MLKNRAYAAFLAGAKEAAPEVKYDLIGYADCWQDNLMQGLPLEEIAADLGAGAGRELDEKLRAAHSSSALAVNTFAPWRKSPQSLKLFGQTGFSDLHFEAKCSTGLGGTPPHLDLILDGPNPIAIESKCTEWMTPESPEFSPSYDRLRMSRGDCSWFSQVDRLRAAPFSYQFLNAAQLVKHALGLLRRYPSRAVHLMYLYWEPRNSGDWPECAAHRKEVDDLASRVKDSPVQLVPISYRTLWTEIERQSSPGHVTYLRTRYDRYV